MKFLSCMDAVFKLLHVEVARKATDGNEKKIYDGKFFPRMQGKICFF